jgi:hypothetical protein
MWKLFKEQEAEAKNWIFKGGGTYVKFWNKRTLCHEKVWSDCMAPIYIEDRSSRCMDLYYFWKMLDKAFIFYNGCFNSPFVVSRID